MNDHILEQLSIRLSSDDFEPATIEELVKQFDISQEIEPDLVILLVRRKDLFSQQALNRYLSVFPHTGFMFNAKDIIVSFQALPDGFTLFKRFVVAYRSVDANILTIDAISELMEFIDQNSGTNDGDDTSKPIQGTAVSQIYEYLEYESLPLMPFADVPTYMLPKPDEDLVLRQDLQEVKKTVPVSELIKTFKETITNQGLRLINEDSITSDLSKMLEEMTMTEKSEIYNLMANYERVKEIRLDKEIFRRYGPVNAKSVEESVNDLKYGGPRMLLDTQHEFDDEGEERLSFWFKGNCDYCKFRIKSPYHAMRLPVMNGGWKGCFCRLECVLAYLQAPFDTEQDEDMLIQKLGRDLFERIKAECMLAEFYHQCLQDYGIYDL